MAIKIDQKITGWEVVEETKPVEKPKPLKRPEYLEGRTYKIANHAEHYNLYMTVNCYKGKPFEVFFDSSHTDSVPWVKALGRLASALLRSPDENLNLEFLSKQLMTIHSNQGYHTGGKGGYVPGIVFHIGKVLSQIAKEPWKAPQEPVEALEQEKPKEGYLNQVCPECKETTMRLVDNCPTCDCGYSKCG